MKIRRASQDDLDAIISIKQRLAFAGESRGGFLLGCDRAEYLARLSGGAIWVLQGASRVAVGQAQPLVGFAVTLSPNGLQSSPLWALRDRVQWAAGGLPSGFDVRRVGYFDQLAVLPHASARSGLALGYFALQALLAQCDYVLTTTVSAPVCNLAAVPLIERVGGVRVGELAETYPEFGPLTSALWLIPAAAAASKFTLHSTAPNVRASNARLERWASALHGA